MWQVVTFVPQLHINLWLFYKSLISGIDKFFLSLSTVDLKQVCVIPYMTTWLSIVVETAKLKKKKHSTWVQICGNLGHGFHPHSTSFCVQFSCLKKKVLNWHNSPFFPVVAGVLSSFKLSYSKSSVFSESRKKALLPRHHPRHLKYHSLTPSYWLLIQAIQKNNPYCLV